MNRCCMADNGDEDDGPLVELGEGKPVEGAPLARVASRLTWGVAKSQVDYQEGDTVIRTPDGPRRLADILADIDRTYFPRRQDFEDAIRDAIGTGPIPTDDEDTADANADPTTDEGDAPPADDSMWVDAGTDADDAAGSADDAGPRPDDTPVRDGRDGRDGAENG